MDSLSLILLKMLLGFRGEQGRHGDFVSVKHSDHHVY